MLEAANKYMNTRLVEQIERRLRDIARKEGGKGVILKHLKMAYRIGFDSSVKTVFLNSVIKNTSKLIQTDQWNQLEESSIMKIYDQDFLAATEGELYMGAKTWCLRNTSSEAEALKIVLDKFPPRITPRAPTYFAMWALWGLLRKYPPWVRRCPLTKEPLIHLISTSRSLPPRFHRRN